MILVNILEINFKNANLGAKSKLWKYVPWIDMFVPLIASKVYHQLIHYIILTWLIENVGAHGICLSNCFLSFSSTAFIQNFIKNVIQWEILKPSSFSNSELWRLKSNDKICLKINISSYMFIINSHRKYLKVFKKSLSLIITDFWTFETQTKTK